MYMIISAIAFTFLNVFVKLLNSFSVYQIIFFRSLGSLFFTTPFLLKLKISFLGNKNKLLVLRSIFGLTSMGLFFLSLKYIDMGTSVALRYVAPVFAAMFALVFLKEKIKPLQWLCFIIAFVGVIFLKGFETNNSLDGILYALFSAIFAGLVYVIIRKIGDQDHPVVIVNYFMVLSMLIGGLLSINYWVTPTLNQTLVLFSLGMFGYFAQLFMTKAMQLGETNQVAPFKYLEVIFTMVIGVVWFSESYTVLTILGVLLIIFGIVLNIFLKQKKV